MATGVAAFFADGFGAAEVFPGLVFTGVFEAFADFVAVRAFPSGDARGLPAAVFPAGRPAARAASNSIST